MSHSTFLVGVMAFIAGGATASYMHVEQYPMLRIYTDPDTQCEYFISRADHVFPRMLPGGGQRGCVQVWEY